MRGPSSVRVAQRYVRTAALSVKVPTGSLKGFVDGYVAHVLGLVQNGLPPYASGKVGGEISPWLDIKEEDVNFMMIPTVDFDSKKFTVVLTVDGEQFGGELSLPLNQVLWKQPAKLASLLIKKYESVSETWSSRGAM